MRVRVLPAPLSDVILNGERTMNAEQILEAIQQYVDENDGHPWRDRAKALRALAEASGREGGLRELVSWFGGDIDAAI